MTKPLKVLVVDDGQDNVTLTARILSMAGHSVSTAETCDDAVAAARNERFDVVVTEVGLPDCDGAKLLAEIRAMYPVRGVVLTAYPMNQQRDRFQQAGFTAFLAKPADFNDIVQAVSTVATSQ